MRSLARDAAADAATLARAGFDAVILENFGDAPFEPGEVEPVTVASLTACVAAAREAAPRVALGVNVLRNDAVAALSIAVATDADFVRINVHTGARITDQGLVEGRAHRTLRLRQRLGAERVALWCDVDVKHAAPLAPRPIEEEAEETAERGLADVLLVTGAGTGKQVAPAHLASVARVAHVPVLVASGASIDALASLRAAHGVVVGSALRADGRAGGRIDEARALLFARAFGAAFGQPIDQTRG